MSDDIREVMRSTPFSPLKRTDHSGDHKKNTEGYSGGWHDDEGQESGEKPLEAGQVEALEREIAAANARLTAAKKRVRLRLATRAGVPVIEITLPDEGAGVTVTRTIEPHEISEWTLRLETAEGLVIDEKL